MITVYKYSLDNWKKNVCRAILPVGAEILKYQYSAGARGEELNIWAKVDTAAAEEVCYFYVVKTGENISKRLEQRDKNKNLEYTGSFFDKNDIHWHIFKAAAGVNSVIGHFWDGNDGLINYKGPTITTTPYYTLCGDTATTTVSSCCDNMNGGSTLTTVNESDINIVED